MKSRCKIAVYRVNEIALHIPRRGALRAPANQHGIVQTLQGAACCARVPRLEWLHGIREGDRIATSAFGLLAMTGPGTRQLQRACRNLRERGVCGYGAARCGELGVCGYGAARRGERGICGYGAARRGERGVCGYGAACRGERGVLDTEQPAVESAGAQNPVPFVGMKNVKPR